MLTNMLRICEKVAQKGRKSRRTIHKILLVQWFLCSNMHTHFEPVLTLIVSFQRTENKGFAPCVIKVQMCSNSRSLLGSNTICGISVNLFFASLPCSSQSPAHIVSQSENSSSCIRQKTDYIFFFNRTYRFTVEEYLLCTTGIENNVQAC